MKIKIYQIRYDAKAFREKAFAGTETLERRFGSAHINLDDDYTMVWQGELQVKSLNEIFQLLNEGPLPEDYHCRSLSVSDVVEIPEGLFFVDSYGFKKLAKCPNCGKWYADRPALSRQDNKTELCSACGMAEALKVFQRVME